jgi:hypothetical protein
MKRIDSPNRAPDLFGVGKDGFRASTPGVSSATELTEKWFNAVQEGLVRTIEAAGVALSEADYDQFTNAILWHASQAAVNKVTQGGGAGQIAGLVKIGAAAGSKLKAEVDGVDRGNFAFEGWVAAQIAALVNSSPAALDTLNELAAALGNDASFATTMTTALANKERKFDTGTRMLFQQTAAPVGWTKVTTHDNKALRVVSGAAGTGGSIDFTTAFANGATGSHVLTLAEIPSHGGHIGGTGASEVENPIDAGNLTYGTMGGGAGHTHTLSLEVKYVDIIIASKD